MSFGFGLADMRRHIGDDDADEISAVSSAGIGGTSADTDTPAPSITSDGNAMREQAGGRRRGGGGGGGYARQLQRKGERLKDYRNWQKALKNATSQEEVDAINKRRSQGNYDYDLSNGPPAATVGATDVPGQNRDAVTLSQGQDVDEGVDDGGAESGGGGGGGGGGGNITINITTSGGSVSGQIGPYPVSGTVTISTTECSSDSPDSGDGKKSNAYQPPGG